MEKESLSDIAEKLSSGIKEKAKEKVESVISSAKEQVSIISVVLIILSAILIIATGISIIYLYKSCPTDKKSGWILQAYNAVSFWIGLGVGILLFEIVSLISSIKSKTIEKVKETTIIEKETLNYTEFILISIAIIAMGAYATYVVSTLKSNTFVCTTDPNPQECISTVVQNAMNVPLAITGTGTGLIIGFLFKLFGVGTRIYTILSIVASVLLLGIAIIGWVISGGCGIRTGYAFGAIVFFGIVAILLLAGTIFYLIYNMRKQT